MIDIIALIIMLLIILIYIIIGIGIMYNYALYVNDDV